MKISKYILGSVLACGLALPFTSCDDNDLNPTSIFDTEEGALDPFSPTYQLDKYCDDVFRTKYNLKMMYKMEDVAADMDYNLVPAEYDKSVDLAVLSDYLWFQVYDKVVTSDPNFMKKYSPRLLHFIGCPAVNAANQTITLGLAEGGLKVTLFNLNEMDPTDVYQLTDRYFHTMHHEFAHVLHQTKTYPKVFDQLSVGHYDALGWQYRDTRVTATLGFVTPYASGQPREDFAETIACYICYTDETWNDLLQMATEPWIESGNSVIKNPAGDQDGVDGKAMILQKVDIARTWFRDAWGIDLDALREEVQLRQTTYNEAKLNELRKLVYDIPVGADAQK